MWRFLRTPKTSLTSSLIRRQTPGSQVVLMHRVKVKKRSRIIRNFVIGAGTLFVCHRIYQTVVIEPYIRALSKIEVEREELEKPLFFAVPLTIRSIPSQPYRATDPEWQAFVRLGKDKELRTRIRRELADVVRSVVEANPLLIQRCGNNWSIRRSWLDIDYPYRPPPKFIRSGIEITPKEIVWTSKEMDASTAMRIQRTLWPSPLATSVFSFVGTLLKQNAFDLAKFLGYQPTDPAQIPGPPNPAIKLQQQATKDPASVKDPAAMAAVKRRTLGGSSAATSAAAADTAARSSVNKDVMTEKPATSPSPTTPNNPDMTKAPSPKDLYPYDNVRSHINDAWSEMKKKWAQTWKPHRDLPPRGCIMVSGLVELETKNASIVIDVYAWWDPKTNKYDARSMWMRLRRLQHKFQKAQR